MTSQLSVCNRHIWLKSSSSKELFSSYVLVAKGYEIKSGYLILVDLICMVFGHCLYKPASPETNANSPPQCSYTCLLPQNQDGVFLSFFFGKEDGVFLLYS